jgi:hypothetical protein
VKAPRGKAKTVRYEILDARGRCLAWSRLERSARSVMVAGERLREVWIDVSGGRHAKIVHRKGATR